MSYDKTTLNYTFLLHEEQQLIFSSFCRADALRLGQIIHEVSASYAEPLATEIVINGLVVYRYFADRARPDSDLWLKRKRNAVELMHMSSLRFGYWLSENHETLESRKLDPNAYAAGGGGMPIVIANTGIIGSVCVSGQPDHLDDHEILVTAITRLIAEKCVH